MAKMKNFLYYNKNKGLGNASTQLIIPRNYSDEYIQKAEREHLGGMWVDTMNFYKKQGISELEKIKANNDLYFIELEEYKRGLEPEKPNSKYLITNTSGYFRPINGEEPVRPTINLNELYSKPSNPEMQNNSIQPQNNNLTSQNAQSKEQESIFSPINLLIIGAIAFLLLNPKK